MNNVVGHSGVVRLVGEDFLQNRAGLFLVGVGLIGRQRRGVEGERVKRRRFAVLGITHVHLFHGLLVREGTRAMVELVGVLIKSLDRRDVVLFTVGRGA